MHGIFISAGDREQFASFAIRHLAQDFVLLTHHYGEDPSVARKLRAGCQLFRSGKGGKFNNLLRLYQEKPEVVTSLETLWVCDDDLILRQGNPLAMAEKLLASKLMAVAPAFSRLGRISHPITARQEGAHQLRITNFIEMTAPLFRAEALAGFLDRYDGSLDGWGTDWWFLNLFGAKDSMSVAIDDQVTVINPHESIKFRGYREIETLASNRVREAQWNVARSRFGLKMWEHRNLEVRGT